jgi:hypothetical protein
MLLRLITASTGKRGFTYTHKPVLGNSYIAKYNRIAIARANSIHFCINLSADGLKHADKLLKLKIAPVTVTLPSEFVGKSFKTPEGNKGIVCPAVIRNNITCSTCSLCADHKRKYLIGFLVHGNQKAFMNKKIIKEI